MVLYALLLRVSAKTAPYRGTFVDAGVSGHPSDIPELDEPLTIELDEFAAELDELAVDELETNELELMELLELLELLPLISELLLDIALSELLLDSSLLDFPPLLLPSMPPLLTPPIIPPSSSGKSV